MSAADDRLDQEFQTAVELDDARDERVLSDESRAELLRLRERTRKAWRRDRHQRFEVRTWHPSLRHEEDEEA